MQILGDLPQQTGSFLLRASLLAISGELPLKMQLERQRITVALLAAAVLVLQSFFISWASAAQPTVDAFGNPLCITNTEDGSATSPGDHSKNVNCCEFGCNWASSGLAMPSSDGATLAWQTLDSRQIAILDDAVQIEEPDHGPGNPRGPPRLTD